MSWLRRFDCRQRVEKKEEFRSSQLTDQLEALFKEKLQTAAGRRLLATYAAAYVRDRYVRNITAKDPMLERVWLILDAIGKNGC